MTDRYGTERVLEPKHVLPTSAWRLDNSKKIKKNEIRIEIKRIQIETTGFKQIAAECNHSFDAMQERIIDIVTKRGKLHNPITNTGGVVFGVVEEIGEEYHHDDISVGDEILCNASLAVIPLFIKRITKIDFAYSQVEAEGYAIIPKGCPVVKLPEHIPIELLLFSFDESGTLMDVSNCAKGKKNFLVTGSNIFTNLLFGSAIRIEAGEDARIVCLLDQSTNNILKGKKAGALLDQVFSEIYTVNILKPIECIEHLKMEDAFDMCVNCADIPGSETVNVMAAKFGGVIYFTNLISNHYLALYVTEAAAKEIEIKCAQGFLKDYDKFNIRLFKYMEKNLDGIKLEVVPWEKYDDYGTERDEQAADAKTHDRRNVLEDFICESRAMQAMLDQVLSVAKYDCNVLITGETGVGKEKVAALLHKNSGRNMKPFVKINCAAISENLIESELFGYERGSFTGASAAGKKGYFEIADNGIIFLDEVGELPLDLQAKLLRAIQEGEFFRVGGVSPIRTNVRIISATNKDLTDAIRQKTFREDLYYRLNVFPLKVPTLDERRSEIPALVRHFTVKYNKKFGISKMIMADAVEYLKERRWKGNIRELENVVQRLLINAKGDVVTIFDVMRELHADMFPVHQEEYEVGKETIYLEKLVHNFEREIIRFAMEKHGSTRKAAKALGISQTQLVRKKNSHGI